jgi:transcriptional regulator with XRE-family HTH domain
MANNLKRLRNERGWSQDRLAELLGTGRSQIAKLEAGKRRLSDVWIDRAAKVFDIDPGLLVSESDGTTVPVVGHVGAGAEAHLYSEGQGPFDYVEAPEGSTDETVAVQIKGDSLGRAFNDWLIFYDDVRGPPTDDLLSKLCVVGLADGRVLVKILERGGIPNTFNLYPNTDSGVIYDAVVEWAAKVKTIVSR